MSTLCFSLANAEAVRQLILVDAAGLGMPVLVVWGAQDIEFLASRKLSREEAGSRLMRA